VQRRRHGDNLMTVPVLAEHEAVESQEVVSDEVLIPARDPGYEPLAYRLQFEVQSKLVPRWLPRRRKSRGPWWRWRGWSWRRNVVWMSEGMVLRDLRPWEHGRVDQRKEG
jgi:hypothetical protein